MFPKINIFFWLIIIVGIAGLLLGKPYVMESWFFTTYKSTIELYLFGFTSFLILKRVFFYRLKGNIDVIRLVKPSDYQRQLFWQGVALALIYITYTWFHFDTFSHSNTLVIIVLTFYYLVQLLINSNPSLYIDEHSFSYDDYFVSRWSWGEIEQIILQDNQLLLIGASGNFQLNFDLVNDIDYVKLNEEVEHNILDGDFGAVDSSKTLIQILQDYSERYQVKMTNMGQKVV